MTRPPDSDLGPLFADPNQPAAEDHTKSDEKPPQKTGVDNPDRILPPDEARRRLEEIRLKLMTPSSSRQKPGNESSQADQKETPAQILTRLGGQISFFSWPSEKEMDGDKTWTSPIDWRHKNGRYYEEAVYITDLTKQPGWVAIEFRDGTTGICQRLPGTVARIWSFTTSALPRELQEWK